MEHNGDNIEQRANGTGTDSSSAEPDRSTRARKGTITLCSGVTSQVRSFLDDEGRDEDSGEWRAISGTSEGTAYSHRPRSGEFMQYSKYSKTLRQGTSGDSAAPSGMTPPGILNYHLAREPKEPTERLSPIAGFLVSFDRTPAGEAYVLREGRWIITSVPVALPQATIVIEDSSVCPVHATLHLNASGSIYILDQFSTTGTAVLRAGEPEEQRVTITAVNAGHGDRVRFGERTFSICMIQNDLASGLEGSRHLD